MPELCTVSAVVAWTGASTADATLILAGVEARIANYCNRKTHDGSAVWEDTAKTEFLDGEWSDGVLLNWRPIVGVTSITQITGSSTSYAYTLTDFTVDGIEIAGLSTNPAPYGRLQMRGGVSSGYWESDGFAARRSRVSFPNFGAGRNRIKVVYTGGYTTIPDDLKLAALEACKSVYNAKSVSATLKSESLGNYSYENVTGAEAGDSEWIFGNVKDLLQPYRSYARII